MLIEFEEYVLDIAMEVSRSLGDTLEVSSTRWISRPIGKGRVKDATLAFYVDGKRRSDDIVLLISNPSFPSVVQADVAQAREIAVRVSHRVGCHIAMPVVEGRFGKQTYAAFTRLSPLSDFRLVKAFQRRRAGSVILPWIVELAKETRQYPSTPSDIERYFVQPLVSLRDDEALSGRVRDRATEYLGVVRGERVSLFTAAQHGDFWIGNVFFVRRAFPRINPVLGDFTVIDWRGSRMNGYPCVDWMRLCSSLFKVGSSSNDRLISAYQSALGISALEFQVYCFLALGRLGEELDQFPKERYIAMCDKALAFIDAHSRSE
ncbi:hypothetical protein [Tropicimonas sp. IMCC6043]|uniref:hypothetical protein n=1 Tax=Tropicimonas sp. IMCC6043 TaxID=2510645 RepID=UPI00101C33AF|nr:hypothetical protein [Tropicimonas sp. IMCC6043]RYH06237.1 hypothetical protein EU800_24500 [Tropicimonas sp. IMCC6043]